MSLSLQSWLDSLNPILLCCVAVAVIVSGYKWYVAFAACDSWRERHARRSQLLWRVLLFACAAALWIFGIARALPSASLGAAALNIGATVLFMFLVTRIPALYPEANYSVWGPRTGR